jgi:hypothetical protein
MRLLRQVVFPAEAAAQEFINRVRSGMSFEEVAQRNGFGASDVALGVQLRGATREGPRQKSQQQFSRHRFLRSWGL